MEEYIGKFEMPYIECQNFKEKEGYIISGIISGGRIGSFINFSGFANIAFDDEDIQHWHPKVTILEKFTRSNSNALVYNINSNNKYNKIFVYKTNTKDSGFYGLLFYNTETNKSLHIFNVELDYSRLVINMSRVVENNQL